VCAHACVCACARACLCDFLVRAGHESVRVRVCECPRASESVRVRVRAAVGARPRACAAASMRMCVFACVFARICVRAFACAHLCARAGPCARAYALPRVSVHAWVRVRMRVWACRSIGKHLRVCVHERACACVRGTTLCARLGAEWALWGPAVFIARPAAARAWLRIGATGFRCRARSAAGRTFSNRTLTAEWAAREGHTSVVDAVSGAIYVIGGYDGTYYNDVWASTDGGARAGLRRGGALGGYYGGYYWVTKGTTGVLRGYSGVLQGY
jgi:hypothetical protein